MPSQEPTTLETLAAAITELRGINARLSTLEGNVEKIELELTAYQKGLDGMATTIVVTAGAAVIFAPLIAVACCRFQPIEMPPNQKDNIGRTASPLPSPNLSGDRLVTILNLDSPRTI